MDSDGREWLAASAARDRARADHGRARDDRRARRAARAARHGAARYARRQPGCKALIGSTTGSASCARSRSSPSSATAAGLTTAVTRSVTAGWTSPSTNPIAIARPGISPAKDRPRCAGRYTRPPTPLGALASPTAPTTSRPPSGSAATAPAWRSRASCSSAATTRSASSATTRSWPPDPLRRVKPSLTPMRRGRLPNCCCRHLRVDGLERSSGRNASPSGITPSNILSPARSQPRVVDRSKPGRPRAHHPPPTRPRPSTTARHPSRP